jgi:hypothetical protein
VSEPGPGQGVGEQEPGCKDRGYGGTYADGYNRYYWLRETPEPGLTDAQAVAQQICFRGGIWVPDGRIIVLQADYLWSDLEFNWKSHEAINSVDGVYSVDADESQNRLVIGVRTPYAAELLRQSIEASEIPIDAVIIEPIEQGRIDDRPANVSPPDGNYRITVETASTVLQGEELAIRTVITNTRLWVTGFEHDNPAENVKIFNEEGVEVWTKLGPLRFGTGASTTLPPGGRKVFETTWPLLDTDGRALPPGLYFVRAYMTTYSEDEHGRNMRHELATEAVRFEIK